MSQSFTNKSQKSAVTVSHTCDLSQLTHYPDPYYAWQKIKETEAVQKHIRTWKSAPRDYASSV